MRPAWAIRLDRLFRLEPRRIYIRHLHAAAEPCENSRLWAILASSEHQSSLSVGEVVKGL